MLQEKAFSESQLQVLDNVQDQRHMALHLRSNIFLLQKWRGVPLKANVVKGLLKKSFKVNTCWSFHFLTLYNPALFGPYNTQGGADLPQSFFLFS